MSIVVSRLSLLAASALLAACASPPTVPPTAGHLQKDEVPAAGDIPPPVSQTLYLPPPKSAPRSETYSVVVNNVRIHELLFALARDARVNVDIHRDIVGLVTLNAVDQTLPQILERLAKQADFRWEKDGDNYVIRPDTAYLATYSIDYVNMTRDTSGTIGVTTEVGTTTGGNNVASTKIVSESTNRFWATLQRNLEELVREQDKYVTRRKCDQVTQDLAQQRAENKASSRGTGTSSSYSSGPSADSSSASSRDGSVSSRTESSGASGTSGRGDNVAEGSSRSRRDQSSASAQSCSDLIEAAMVIAHPETGTVAIRAKSAQHERIRQFLAQVTASARKQALIEATVVEVQLNNDFQQGIDWSTLRNSPTASGFDLSQVGTPVTGTGLLSFVARNRGDNSTFSAAIKLLEQFGTTKVLSSPKISVLNNQTAVLKVVDNIVYFTITAESQTVNNVVTTQFATIPSVIPVGLVMTVTPQIAESGEITLNVRPSISRIIGTTLDPNPDLAKNGIKSEIPIVRAREMESILRVADGSTAILGGLMEDSLEDASSAVPWFHSIPLIGALFSQHSRSSRKNELVVLIRPTIVQSFASPEDRQRAREHLPAADFFANNPGPRYQLLPSEKLEPDR